MQNIREMGRGKAVTTLEDAIICRAIKVNGMSKADVAKLVGRSRKTIFDRIRAMKETGQWDQFELDIPRPDLDLPGADDEK